ncbi:3-isopropylmalate dehydratase large subunit [Pseudomonas sp. Pf153]|uniref:3-isopropylmalate dehydratase large subunit n=1 Tax=Pseudomonas sp. Pf153 TaxID=1699309 RepID=UPI0009EBC083|nr:3-isopropylmalate dehydratase large subunit [Pseudomonas sp. Pf153]
MMPETLYDKLWSSHALKTKSDGTTLLYIDRHLINEVTSPQAFSSLEQDNRSVWRANSIIATDDHNVPTDGLLVRDQLAAKQLARLKSNIANTGALAYFPHGDPQQGIVHVVAPEMGATQPGMAIVCGDSHTSTHGAFAALAFGIGTSEIEHVLATQTLLMSKSKTLEVRLIGQLSKGVYAKDIALSVIAALGASGASGHVLEFTGSTLKFLSMEARMTLCNMAIEAGARAGLIGVDDTTISYLKGRTFSPPPHQRDSAEAYWRTFTSDTGAKYDKRISISVEKIKPCVTWGTSPDMMSAIDGCVPSPSMETDFGRRRALEQSLVYMGLEPGRRLDTVVIDKVFIGSCTNARIEDLREAASILRGRKISRTIKLALAVPGSGAVKRQAETEGIDKIFIEAGFQWRQPGCSMCLGMNEDRLSPGERCASTSNRNFEGRQGAGGRSHLLSPAMAAAASLTGYLCDVREFLQ